jgi:6-pyruvoyltetrahydropterin/6-carboxytetrahydropterin synthase
MYTIKVEADFSSAHNLRGYKGKCEDLHGHNWQVELAVSGKKLDKLGMLADFRLLKDKLNAVLEKLDHKYLNNIPYFKKINPTSENIARHIYDCLKPQIPGISSVTVWESENSSATYHAG